MSCSITRLVLGSAGCFLVALGGASAQAPSGPLQLRIGSWNIEHLGDPGSRRGTGQDVLQNPKDLARYIRYAQVDVLAVQEIAADAEAPDGFPKKYRTNSILAKALGELNKTPGQQWRHILFPKMRTSETSQWVGVAWNAARVKATGAIYQVPVGHSRSVQDSNLWDRNLHAMMFSAGKDKTDFLVLPIHLKANASASFERHRGEEIEEFVKRRIDLDKAFPKERDMIVLGDTNIQDADESAIKLFEKAGFRDLNKADLDTHTAKGVQPFDRVFVPREQKEFAQSRLEVLSAFQKKEELSFAEFRARYSDHYIVVTTIQIMDDDD